MVATLEVLMKLRDEMTRDLSLVGAAGVVGLGLAVKSAIDFEASAAGIRKGWMAPPGESPDAGQREREQP